MSLKHLDQMHQRYLNRNFAVDSWNLFLLRGHIIKWISLEFFGCLRKFFVSRESIFSSVAGLKSVVLRRICLCRIEAWKPLCSKSWYAQHYYPTQWRIQKFPGREMMKCFLLESGRGNWRPIYRQGRLGKMIFGLNDWYILKQKFLASSRTATIVTQTVVQPNPH